MSFFKDVNCFPAVGENEILELTELYSKFFGVEGDKICCGFSVWFLLSAILNNMDAKNVRLCHVKNFFSENNALCLSFSSCPENTAVGPKEVILGLAYLRDSLGSEFSDYVEMTKESVEATFSKEGDESRRYGNFAFSVNDGHHYVLLRIVSRPIYRPVIVLDYLSTMPTTCGLSSDPNGDDMRDLFRRMRNFAARKSSMG